MFFGGQSFQAHTSQALSGYYEWLAKVLHFPDRVMATAAASLDSGVDITLNPQIAGLKVAKTMALTDLAKSMREAGKDVIGLAAGEPDFDTPEPIVTAGINAIRWDCKNFLRRK